MDEMTDCKLDFMRLPSEIRISVYKRYFSDHSKQISYPSTRPVSLVDDRFWDLLRVSKSVYAEALPEYYRSCYYNLCSLNLPHRQKLIQDLADTAFGRYTSNLLVWRLPEVEVLNAFQQIRWVKILGVTCGVQMDAASGQAFTYQSLMAALPKSRIPDFSWTRCQALFEQCKHIKFMLDIRCDYWETKFDADGHPRPKSIKTVRAPIRVYSNNTNRN